MKKLFLATALLLAPVAAGLLPLAPASAATLGELGDLSSFETIARDTLALVKHGNLKGAEKRITEFETAWDDAHSTMRPRHTAQWGYVDDAADAAIAALRAKKPMSADAEKATVALLSALRDPTAK